MAPFDWGSDGEEVDPDELNYRNSVRDAVTSGDIQATPTPDGGFSYGTPGGDSPPPPDQPAAPPSPSDMRKRVLGTPRQRVLGQPANLAPPDQPTDQAPPAPDTVAPDSTAATDSTPTPDSTPPPAPVAPPMDIQDGLPDNTPDTPALPDKPPAATVVPTQSPENIAAGEAAAPNPDATRPPQVVLDQMDVQRQDIQNRLNAGLISEDQANAAYSNAVNKIVDDFQSQPTLADQSTAPEDRQAPLGSPRADLLAGRQGDSRYGEGAIKALAAGSSAVNSATTDIPVVSPAARVIKSGIENAFGAIGSGFTPQAPAFDGGINQPQDNPGFDVGHQIGSVPASFVPVNSTDWALTLAPFAKEGAEALDITKMADLAPNNLFSKVAGVVQGTDISSFLKNGGQDGLIESLTKGIDTGAEFGPGTNQAALKATLNSGTDYIGNLTKMRGVADDILKNGAGAIQHGLTPEQARLLTVPYEAVKNAAPNDLVTVYHVTDSDSAMSIARDGFKRGGFLTTDPEVALLHTTDKGVEDPNLVSFQIPRSSIKPSAANPSVFTALKDIRPFMNEATDGWVQNAGQVFSDFLTSAKQNLSSEFGGLTIPGVQNNDIPDDVANLAFGGSSRSSEAIDAGENSLEGQSVKDIQKRLEAARAIRAGMEPGAPEFDGTGSQDFYRALDRSGEPTDLDYAMEQNRSHLADFNDNGIRDLYYNALRSADAESDARDAGRIVDPTFNALGVPKNGINPQRMQGIVEYGEELYRRTNGKEGMMPRVARAAKQLMVNEEGSINPAAFAPDFSKLGNGPVQYQSLPAPPVHTARLTGIGPIDPHLTPVERALNVTRNIIGNITSAGTASDLFGFWNDPLMTSLTKERDSAVLRMTSERVAAVAQADQATKSAFKFAKDGVTVVSDNLPGKFNTIQDIAADLRAWLPVLTDPQKSAMTTLQRLMEPYTNAVMEQGLVDAEHIRSDIKEGGFYLPRGDHERDVDRSVVKPWSRALKVGAEKPATFPTMGHGLEWAAKTNTPTYVPLTNSLENYFKDMGGRVLDKHLANVLANVRDETGRLLTTTPQFRILQDNPELFKQMGQLKKIVTSLEGSISSMDAGARQAMVKFIYTPAPDLDELRNAMDSISTKAGTLRVKPTLAPGDQAQDWKTIRKSVNEEIFRNRGQYKGMTDEQARKAAVQNLLDNQAISRGRFKGLSPDQATAMLSKAQESIKNMAVDWQAAKTKANFPGPGEVSIETKGPQTMGKNLNGVSFPDAMGSDLNKYIHDISPATGPLAPYIRKYNAANNLLRELRSTWDLSFAGIQGLLGLHRDPVSYGHALSLGVHSMFGEDGELLLGKYFNDFDARAMQKDLSSGGFINPKVADWASAGAHLNGINTEYTEGGLSKLPIFEQSDRAFGYFGDVQRLDGMQRDLGKWVDDWNMKNSGSPQPDELKDAMQKIASIHNNMTGYSPNKLLGGLGSLVFFAPRMYNAQLTTLAKAVAGNEIERPIARDALLHMVGQGVMSTAAANYVSGNGVGNPNFDWWSPMKNGRMNPNFMRIRTPKGTPGGALDVSLFGPWDSLLSGIIGAGTGNPAFLARSKAAPVAGLLWTLIDGKDAVGNPITLQNSWRQIVPFSVANVGKESPLQTATSLTGLKESPMSPSEQFNVFRQNAVERKIKDGTIPANQADYYKDLNSLGSGEMRQVDAWVKEASPEDFANHQAARRKTGSIFQQVADQADAATQRYAKDEDKQFDALLNGESPKSVWDANNNTRQQMTGAKESYYGATPDKTLSDSQKKQISATAQKYQDAISKLRPNDIRAQEAAYNAITTAAYERRGGVMTSDDFDKLAQDKTDFLTHLANTDPAMFDRMANNIQLNQQLGFEDSHPIDQLRKAATQTLQPYYDLVKSLTDAGQPVAPADQWLNANPQADFMHWMTSKTDAPTLHSVDAVATAINKVPKRAATLSGASTVIDQKNLPIVQQYGNEINQLLTLSNSTLDENGRKTNDITKLRQQDPLYDALYFYLGFDSPTKDIGVDNYRNRNAGTAPVYHLGAVEDYLKQWGDRTDGAQPRRY